MNILVGKNKDKLVTKQSLIYGYKVWKWWIVGGTSTKFDSDKGKNPENGAVEATDKPNRKLYPNL